MGPAVSLSRKRFRWHEEAEINSNVYTLHTCSALRGLILAAKLQILHFTEIAIAAREERRFVAGLLHHKQIWGGVLHCTSDCLASTEICLCRSPFLSIFVSVTFLDRCRSGEQRESSTHNDDVADVQMAIQKFSE